LESGGSESSVDLKACATVSLLGIWEEFATQTSVMQPASQEQLETLWDIGSTQDYLVGVICE